MNTERWSKHEIMQNKVCMHPCITDVEMVPVSDAQLEASDYDLIIYAL